MKNFIIVILLTQFFTLLSAETLKLEHYLYPLKHVREDARKINDLKLMLNKLYIGYGDYGINTGPTEIISYDVRNGRQMTEFVADDEAIMKYCLADSVLMVPGADATEDWTFGNIYIRQKNDWVKHRNIPKGLHVFDICSYKGNLFVSTGSAINFDDNNQPAMGCIFSSKDKSKSWDLVYTTPSDAYSVYRVNELIEFKGLLYAFIHSFYQVNKKDLPQKYQEVIAGDSLRLVNILRSDPIGKSELICYDGTYISNKDIIPEDNIGYINPILFKDQLLLECYQGDLVYSMNGNKAFIKKLYYLYDGEKVEKIELPYDRIVDYTTDQKKLYVLGFVNNKPVITVFSDFKTFKTYDLPQKIYPLSVEIVLNQILIGCDDGNIYKTNLSKFSKEIQYPSSYVCQSEKPKNGNLYQISVTERNDWMKDSRFSLDNKDNLIEINTDNVLSFILFITDDLKKETINLKINQEKITIPLKKTTSSLLITIGNKNTVVQQDQTLSEYRFEPKILTVVDDSLQTGVVSLNELYVASQMEYGDCDLVLAYKDNFQRKFKNGNLTIDDLYENCYRNNLLKLTLKGKELKLLLSSESKLANQLMVRFSDNDRSLDKMNEFLKDNKTYKVMVNDYLAEKIEKELSISLEKENQFITVNRVILSYLLKHPELKLKN